VNINQVLRTYFTVNGIDITTVRFYAQDFTQKLSVAIKSGYGVKFPPGIAHILGYADNAVFFNSGVNFVYYDAATSAKFNNIISLNLNCNLASSCFYNGQYSNLLATIPITASVGKIINYTPYKPIMIDSSHLAGSVINRVTLEIKDQVNRPVIIAEEWNVAITIEWE
jgi:hypothetical protein